MGRNQAQVPAEARRFRANKLAVAVVAGYRAKNEAWLASPGDPWEFGQARVWDALGNVDSSDDLTEALQRVTRKLGYHGSDGTVGRPSQNATGDHALEWAGALGALEFIAGIIEASEAAQGTL